MPFSKKRILLYNDNSKRDLLTITILKNELKKRGHIVKITNPDFVRIDVYLFDPDIFIGARADHSSPIREISNFCDTFVLPGEGGHMTKETMLSVFLGRSYFKLDDVSWLDKCFLWSQRTKDWLLESKMLVDEKLDIVGNPRLDIYKSIKFKQNLQKQKNKITIGVAFSAKAVSSYYGGENYALNFYESPMHSYPILANKKRGFEDIIWRDHAILHKMMECLNKIILTTDFNIVLRPGPFEDYRKFRFLEKKSNFRIKVDYKSSLPEFVLNTDVLLTCWSTVGLEFLICDKPVISIAGLFDQEHLFSHISKKASGFETFVKFYHQPNKISEIINLINNINNRSYTLGNQEQIDIRKMLDETYTYSNEGFASDKICDIIDNYEISKKKFDKRKNKKNYLPIRGLFYPLSLYKFISLFYIWIFKYFTTNHPLGIIQFRKNNDNKINSFLKRMLYDN